ncbi:glycosyltransferase family 4 protein [Staphylococcus chromogenes]|uniref:glycosyltransferase family 4 protein n=1 Tax=Staphylococcus chromogenes TaxID=46126 RepID=UPI002886672C|nr:glycosyltransferase family 4 protein [Staphylococcus chromogenes]MDT0716206.1 glycosyltransferase family 4 protein [Staphylococcus chromogenes]
MNVLFLTMVKIDSKYNEGIYQDFIKELSEKVDNVYVVSPIERRQNESTHLINEGNVKILRVKTGDVTKTSKIKKGINQLKLQKQFEKSINQYFKNINFDLIVYSTPPITFAKLILKLKKRFNATTYLMLKDIFPQNAVDLQMMSKKSFIYKMFRKREIKTYEVSDLIGVMSEENKKYIIKHNNILEEKVHVFRNATYNINSNFSSKSILTKFGIDEKTPLIIYGGNIGEPQGFKNIIKFIKNFHKVKRGTFIVIGDGTRFNEVRVEAQKVDNVYVFNRLPKKEYDSILRCSDIGLIFLDERFTIPNYPSRMTSYLSLGKPIIANVDNATDISRDIEDNKVGFAHYATEIDESIISINKLIEDKELYNLYSKNAKAFFNREFKIEQNVDYMLAEVRRIKYEEIN